MYTNLALNQEAEQINDFAAVALPAKNAVDGNRDGTIR